jgi:hypothetical protein
LAAAGRQSLHNQPVHETGANPRLRLLPSAPTIRSYPHVGFSSTMRRMSCSISPSVLGRPIFFRLADPSNFWATDMNRRRRCSRSISIRLATVFRSLSMMRASRLNLTLERSDESNADRRPGTLTLRTTPWAKVTIDGKPFGSTPLYKVELGSGPHTVRLVNEEFGVDETRKVIIKPGQASRLNLTLKPSGG